MLPDKPGEGELARAREKVARTPQNLAESGEKSALALSNPQRAEIISRRRVGRERMIYAKHQPPPSANSALNGVAAATAVLPIHSYTFFFLFKEMEKLANTSVIDLLAQQQ